MSADRSRLTLNRPSLSKPRLARGAPFSMEAEQGTIGAAIKDTRVMAELIEILPEAEQFYSLKHQRIYSALLRMFERSQPADITTLSEELDTAGDLEGIGGRSYLIDLVEAVATTANASYYAEIVSKKDALRNMIDVSTEIVKICQAEEMDVNELLDYAEQKVFAISESRMRKGFIRLDTLLPHTFKQMEEFQESEGGLAGMKSGFEALDNLTAGLHKGEFVVIAGRPSMGKSALALNIAENVAINEKVAVGFFSIEMSKESLAMRMLCGRAKVSQHKLRAQKLSDSEWQKLAVAGGPLSEAPIYIDDSGSLSALEMRAKARRLKAQHNVGLIVVDYLQMMHGHGRPENRQQEMSLISRSMKELAKELDLPVIACSQLSRQVEQRGGEKRPQLSDLRESGAIEQDADVVIFVYREEYYLRHLDPHDPKYMESENQAEIIVAKQRNGPTGIARMLFLKEYIRFENQAPGFRAAGEPFGGEGDEGEEMSPF
ncbi:MAG: replicative DNA helicase [candidate division Zixibacteria bacterium]|nr:replicative DNA helicase [candidate division Zixibacteria bacterium]